MPSTALRARFLPHATLSHASRCQRLSTASAPAIPGLFHLNLLSPEQTRDCMFFACSVADEAHARMPRFGQKTVEAPSALKSNGPCYELPIGRICGTAPGMLMSTCAAIIPCWHFPTFEPGHSLSSFATVPDFPPQLPLRLLEQQEPIAAQKKALEEEFARRGPRRPHLHWRMMLSAHEFMFPPRGRCIAGASYPFKVCSHWYCACVFISAIQEVPASTKVTAIFPLLRSCRIELMHKARSNSCFCVHCGVNVCCITAGPLQSGHRVWA